VAKKKTNESLDRWSWRSSYEWFERTQEKKSNVAKLAPCATRFSMSLSRSMPTARLPLPPPCILRRDQNALRHAEANVKEKDGYDPSK
jgi:hypothetical protein